MTAPRPFVPPTCDIRDYPGMMLDIARLRGSAFDATPNDAAWRAGVNLWMTAFHGDQGGPSGSLEGDDASLTRAAQLGRDVRSWKKIKAEVLADWTVCADGRLYHRVVSEVVLEVWIDKLLRRLQSSSGNARPGRAFTFDPAETQLDLEIAAEHLSVLSPKSKALAKVKRKGMDLFRPGALRTAREQKPNGGPSHLRTEVRTEPQTEPVRGPKVEVRREKEDSSLRSESGRHGTGASAPASTPGVFDALEGRLREAGGEGIDDPASAPALIDLSPIMGLLSPGTGPPCDLELDVLPTIRRMAGGRRRPRSIRSWAFFTSAIAEARDRRLQGAPAQAENLHHERPDHPARNGSVDRDDRIDPMLRGLMAAAEG